MWDLCQYFKSKNGYKLVRGLYENIRDEHTEKPLKSGCHKLSNENTCATCYNFGKKECDTPEYSKYDSCHLWKKITGEL